MTLDDEDDHQAPQRKDAVPGRIAVVGPCASGKSLLVRSLRELGFDARHVAQEHSYVKDMWARLSRPEVLVFLDAELPTIRLRGRATFPERLLREERVRLSDARTRCDVYVATDVLNPVEVRAVVLAELANLGLRPCATDEPGS